MSGCWCVLTTAVTARITSDIKASLVLVSFDRLSNTSQNGEQTVSLFWEVSTDLHLDHQGTPFWTQNFLIFELLIFGIQAGVGFADMLQMSSYFKLFFSVELIGRWQTCVQVHYLLLPSSTYPANERLWYIAVKWYGVHLYWSCLTNESRSTVADVH